MYLGPGRQFAPQVSVLYILPERLNTIYPMHYVVSTMLSWYHGFRFRSWTLRLPAIITIAPPLGRSISTRGSTLVIRLGWSNWSALCIIVKQHGAAAGQQQFLNNRESRAMLLDAEFRTLCQGALSIDDYCRKMKSMADALADLGEPIQDQTLVLNVLWGLNERFQFMSQLVTHQRSFPSFADVRADLCLAELNMGTPSASPSALVAAPSIRPPTSSSPAPPRHHQATAGHHAAAGQQSSGNRGRRRRGGRGSGGSHSSAQGGTAPATP